MANTKATSIEGISHPVFQDAEKARKYLERIRWPNGPSCPHCGEAEAVTRLKGEKHRPGLIQCNSCRLQFTVTVGTLFERSKVPLNKWMLASYLLCSSKKGISTHQLHRMLGVTYKTAWFMTHRIREAMREGNLPKMGGGGGTVEVDETYWGNTRTKSIETRRGPGHKERIVALVERSGRARSYHVASISGRTLKPILKEQLALDANIMTDDAHIYRNYLKPYASHSVVRHTAGEYVRGKVHTNTIEGFFSILKRGLVGVYQHVSPEHLKRYLSEFDFRYTYRKLTDGERTERALEGITGKRLTYRRTIEKAAC
jgi:transposase-like protein